MRVQYRTQARDDIAEIHDYRSNEHSPDVAMHVELAIRAAIEMLAAHPEFGRKTDHKHAVRRWPMSEYPYTIFYMIDWHIDTITIVRAVQSGRVHDLGRVPEH